MRFSTASKIESITWDMKQADIPRALKRTKINVLFNGEPPLGRDDLAQTRGNTNVNFLDGPQIANDATGKMNSALLTPGNFWNVALDFGPAHKRNEWAGIITKAWNRRLKRSRIFHQVVVDLSRQDVLHGISPLTWDDDQRWCPLMQSLGDVMVPSGTLLTFENFSMYALFRRYTAEQLIRLTRGPKKDPGWRMGTVKRAIKWCYEQYGKSQSTWDTEWSPERQAEDIKSDSGMYSSDMVPTVDCWDFRFFDDSDSEEGWKRKIILDTPASGGKEQSKIIGTTQNILDGRNEFLYDGGTRNFGSNWQNCIHFQIANVSPVAPGRYHSVRSVGYVLYPVCHLQNRLRCKLTDAAFEACLQYIMVEGADDEARLEKVDLMHMGVIPKGLSFVKQQERWQTQVALPEMILQLNQQSMVKNSSSYTQNLETTKDSNREETATEVMAKVNAASSLVGAMLGETYNQWEFCGREIARRFCIPNSRDNDVREFRVECLKAGVPKEALDVNRWDVTCDRVIGSGDASQELASVNMLMSQFVKYSPEAQQLVLRKFTFAATRHDAGLTEALVPVGKLHVSDATHDAELAATTLLAGLPVSIKTGMNPIDYIEALLKAGIAQETKIGKRGNMATPDEILGLRNLLAHIQEHIKLLAQDPEQKQRVKQYNDVLAKLEANIKGYEQRLQQQAKAAQQQAGQNGGDGGKTQSALVLAQTKAKIKEAEAAQKMRHKEAASKQQNALALRQAMTQENATTIKTRADLMRSRMKSLAEPPTEEGNNAS